MITSKDRFREGFSATGRAACLAMAGALLYSVTFAEQPATEMKPVESRELVRTVQFKYTVYRADETVGSEQVTRSEFNDNSVQFQSKVTLDFSQGGKSAVETDLVLEEESLFPISYEMKKTMVQGELEYVVEKRIEWFSNVAVAYRTANEAVDTSRVVLPSGAAIVDLAMVHHLYVPLYWYDVEVGGVQSFNVVDPSSLRNYAATLRLQTSETISVNGDEVESERYEFTRERQVFKIYVDANGRILKLVQGVLVFELAEWSETVVKEK